MSIKRANLRDVAREAGVSYQTVSRVINNHESVSPRTRARVEKAIEKLDYRVNRAAQIMQTKRSNTIEAIIFYAGFNLFLYEMARATQKTGYHFSVSAVTDDEFEKTLQNASSRFVDGLIFLPDKQLSQSYEELSHLCNGIPFVQLGAKLGTNLPSVLYDQRLGARMATQHLIDLGHHEIAEISGPLKNHDGYDRHDAWAQTMRQHGLNPKLSVAGDYTIQGGYVSMQALLAMGEPFTAVFVGNDSMAIGALTALREHGLRVPDDVSIVSFDDTPEAAHIVPALTTIRQDFQLLGQLAVEYLLNCINNPETPIHQRVLQPELVVRQSTRALTR